MILERLFIENYKQLRDPVELHPPEGAIGVVGSNGTGKSTLFESVLWAFFGSKGGGPRFANESIPWSGGSTKDPTTVEITLSTEGGSYTVRRRLKSGSTSAEALDASGKTIATGTADVSRWIESNLLRMDRTAFEATFYARQKELRFFANDDGISRVRRISKLLGINSVEDAQKLLRDDRNELRSEARVLENRLAEADLDALQTELKEANLRCDELEKQLGGVDEALTEAAEELKTTREVRAALEAAYRQHSKLLGDLREAQGDGRRAADRISETEKDLADLDTAAKELERLKPETAKLPEIAAELERLEEERQRSEQRERDRMECRHGQRRISDIEGEVWHVLEALEAGDEPLPGWHDLFELDGAELLAGTTSVLEQAPEALREAESRYEKLRKLEGDHTSRTLAADETTAAEERYKESKDEEKRLAEELEDLSGGEDLERAECDLREGEEKLKQLAAHHRGQAKAAEREAANVEKAREAIDSGADEHCPTCQRGFDDEERDEILDTLRRQVASIRRRATQESEQAAQFTSEAEATNEKSRKLSRRLDRWRELRESLVRVRDRAADRLETLQDLQTNLRRLNESLADTEAPTQADLEDARVQQERLRTLRDARPAVASLATEHDRLAKRVEELLTGIQALENVSYDADKHQAVQQEKNRLERAGGRVEELERRLAQCPEVETALVDAQNLAETARVRAEELNGRISTLAFDEAAYESTSEKVAAQEVKVGELRDSREALGGEWKDADHRIERAKAELKRLDDDRERANERAAAASRMDEMDGLFTEFFRGLTARARPMLEVEASNLVRDLTDNRYERMEFDDNYRVKLLDRFDDSYAIERFSGGESDVASLSARVALSRIVAASGGNTLGFLVLDEVFGSLDAERRTNVLLALERLKRSFGQIFLISHVAEVQESALVDEIWMLEEDDDGKSTVKKIETNLRETDLEGLYNAELGGP